MADLTALLDISNHGLLDNSGLLLTFGSGGPATTNLDLIVNGYYTDAFGGVHYFYRTSSGDNGPLPPA